MLFQVGIFCNVFSFKLYWNRYRLESFIEILKSLPWIRKSIFYLKLQYQAKEGKDKWKEKDENVACPSQRGI